MKFIEENDGPIFDFCYIDGAHDWYTDALAFFNSGAALGDVSWIVGDERYGAYLKQVRKDEKDVLSVVSLFMPHWREEYGA